MYISNNSKEKFITDVQLKKIGEMKIEIFQFCFKAQTFWDQRTNQNGGFKYR